MTNVVMGPLAGVNVIELGGIGPVPFAGMVLSDLGAEVIRVERIEKANESASADLSDVVGRGRRSIAVDLKHPDGRDTVLRLVEKARVVMEGFRPGVTERLGVGPKDCAIGNPGLIYARMTGWGQVGPYARAAGHDINYIALAGALHPIGRRGDPPVPPLNLVGDYGGGGMLLALGIAAALYESRRSGQGQVIDAAMVDGAALLTAPLHGWRHSGEWNDVREANLVDGGAPFYDVYETADGEYISVGSIEPAFYAELRRAARLRNEDSWAAQMDRNRWPAMKERLAEIFRTKTRDEWCALMEGTEVCFAPVLRPSEAPNHPHNMCRRTFTEVEGVVQPAPAPRFSRTESAIQGPPPRAGEQTDDILIEAGYSADDIVKLRSSGAVA